MTSIQKPFIIAGIIFFLFIGLGSFYAGMRYGQSASSATAFQNARPAGGGNFVRARNGGGGMGAGRFITGEVLSKDDKSVTLKLLDGGSKIVFFSSSTSISKSTAGSTEDLAVGNNLMVSGDTNPDGSVTAQTIQLRPAMSSPPTADLSKPASAL